MHQSSFQLLLDLNKIGRPSSASSECPGVAGAGSSHRLTWNRLKIFKTCRAGTPSVQWGLGVKGPGKLIPPIAFRTLICSARKLFLCWSHSKHLLKSQDKSKMPKLEVPFNIWQTSSPKQHGSTSYSLTRGEIWTDPGHQAWHLR